MLSRHLKGSRSPSLPNDERFRRQLYGKQRRLALKTPSKEQFQQAMEELQ